MGGTKNQCILKCYDNNFKDKCISDNYGCGVICELMCCKNCLMVFYFLFSVYLLIEFIFIVFSLTINNFEYFEHKQILTNILITIFIGGFSCCMSLFSNENNGRNYYTITTLTIHLINRFWSFVNLCYFLNNDFVENNTKSIYDIDDNYIIKNIYILSSFIFWSFITIFIVWSLVIWTSKTCAKVAKLENEIKKMKNNEITKT